MASACAEQGDLPGNVRHYDGLAKAKMEAYGKGRHYFQLAADNWVLTMTHKSVAHKATALTTEKKRHPALPNALTKNPRKTAFCPPPSLVSFWPPSILMWQQM
eukprot:1397973-Amphidinium_carterae.1